MNWSVSSGKDGIIQRATFYAFGDSADHTAQWPLADITASGNRWVQKISLKIWAATGLWEMDDKNQTDLPSATTSLVNAQNDYAIPTNYFKIQRVEVLNNSGIWSKVLPMEMRQIDVAIPEFFKTNGLPAVYELRGNSLFLHPAPDNGVSVTLAAGLRIYFTRQFLTFSAPASYTTADSTQPGFDEQFHDTLAKGMALDYCLTNGPADRLANLEKVIMDDFIDLTQHYGFKWRDKKLGVRPRIELYT